MVSEVYSQIFYLWVLITIGAIAASIEDDCVKHRDFKKAIIKAVWISLGLLGFVLSTFN